ncbi:uncharacterized protein LOC122618001 [Drosophila teissieri]|nr:uncharacterized protein LOC120320848 [Drosophila yakuba]XP_039479164.1 uncharacterized protein LOC120443865 [Drosophila santomea]XP_043650044.1 uncharacterized protein LOC122618001 [Drosophila teissieri]
MDAITILGLIYWLICMIAFGPLMFFVCVYLPEVPVRYVKGLRQHT